jgi:hypothetical protein
MSWHWPFQLEFYDDHLWQILFGDTAFHDMVTEASKQDGAFFGWLHWNEWNVRLGCVVFCVMLCLFISLAFSCLVGQVPPLLKNSSRVCQ